MVRESKKVELPILFRVGALLLMDMRITWYKLCAQFLTNEVLRITNKKHLSKNDLLKVIPVENLKELLLMMPLPIQPIEFYYMEAEKYSDGSRDIEFADFLSKFIPSSPKEEIVVNFFRKLF
jgi:hypothetical protein